jgi:hypothetical protein
VGEVIPIPLVYVTLQRSGNELTIGWNDTTKRIVEVPLILSGMLHKDGPAQLAELLGAGWKEIFRGDWRDYYERIQNMHKMHRKKLSKATEVRRGYQRLSVHEEEEDQ